MTYMEAYRILRFDAGVPRQNLAYMKPALVVEWAKAYKKHGFLPDYFYKRWDAKEATK